MLIWDDVRIYGPGIRIRSPLDGVCGRSLDLSRNVFVFDEPSEDTE